VAVIEARRREGHYERHRGQVDVVGIQAEVRAQVHHLQPLFGNWEKEGMRVIVCKGCPGAENDMPREACVNAKKTFGGGCLELTGPEQARMNACVAANGAKFGGRDGL
jgi:hypothetical protein